MMGILPPQECIFQKVLASCSNGEKLFSEKPLSENQVNVIFNSSKERKDGFSDVMKRENSSLTSKSKIAKHAVKRESEGQSTSSSAAKRPLRSSVKSFHYKNCCLFCGEECLIVPDKKHPDRFEKNPGILCRTADRGKQKKTFKEVLEQKCAERGDILADRVRIRLQGAVSDLHAADARYHRNCYRDFVNQRKIQSARNQFDLESSDKDSFNYILKSIRNEDDKIWTSRELLDAYKEKGGTETNSTRLIERIKVYMKDEIYCFKSPGLATIIMHKQKASMIFKLVSTTEDEDDSVEVAKIAKKIKAEIKDISGVKDCYPVLDENTINESVIPTLNDILIEISPQFQANPIATALISNIVTSIATSKVSMLQVALGLFVREQKLIKCLQELGVTSSYDEVRRFRISAAHYASQDKNTRLDCNEGLVQGVSDNFDANLSTQNGLKQTHSLATVLLQHSKSSDKSNRAPIPRLPKKELSTVKLEEPRMQIFKGEKKPKMPQSFAQREVPPLKLLCNQAVMVSRSEIVDFGFIKAVLTKPSIPDFAGYNTKLMRDTGVSPKFKTKVNYKPLINRTPSDPSTILTAMCDIESASQKAGQQETIFTCDQQLYRVTLDIIWNDALRWKHFYPRIGGMHWLMSFVGSVGKLMKNSGLDMLMRPAFAGVEKMLIGKKFPMNVRALRIVVLELLRGLIGEDMTHNDMANTLQDLSDRSQLAEHWIKNLIHPVFLMMMYVRAEREGEFGLHLYCCKKMIPYFFAAGHWNYARDGIVYLMMMEKLPNSLLNKFMNGEHVIHLKDGLFNGIWSDMAIETTYMKVGKGPSGMIGVTTSDRSVAIWANSHHLCGEVLTELGQQRKGTQNSLQHKEEGEGRIKSDSIDRSKIKSTLEKCIHPLKIETHSSNVLVNIYSGEESDASVNVSKASELGGKQMMEFQEGLPDTFRKPLSTKVSLMKSAKDKRSKKKNEKDEYNTDVIFSRVLLLLGTNQIDFENLFDFELAAVPSALFKESGEARYPKSKSVLMNKLKVEESSRGIKPDAVVIDGGGLLHIIHWPTMGTVKDLVNSVEHYIQKFSSHSDVYLIFDRYKAGSIKSDTRNARVGAFRRSHQLSLERKLPSKDMCLSSSITKENLIEILSEELCKRFEKVPSNTQFIVTSKNEVPTEVHKGVRIRRLDLSSSYDEADYMIPQQVDCINEEKKAVIKVLCADTDVFVLLCGHLLARSWSAKVLMDPFSDGIKLININKSVDVNKKIVPSLIALHALSGCDTVPMLHGIGKAKALKALEKVSLIHIGNIDSTIDVVIQESKQFIAKCYGQVNESSSKNRRCMWIHKTDGAKKSAKPPALKNLPPTDEALELNIRRAHYVAIMWKNCVTGRPPKLNPCEYGWEKREDGELLTPTMLPQGVDVAPEQVLKMTRCNCSSSQCKTRRCTCVKAEADCSEFCGCRDCENHKDLLLSEDEDENDEECESADDDDDYELD